MTRAQFHDNLLPVLPDLARLSPDDMSRRLKLALNSYYQLLLPNATTALLGDALGDVARYGHDFSASETTGGGGWPRRQVPMNASDAELAQQLCQPFCKRSAVAVVARSEQVFRAHPVWLPLLFASAAVLLAAGAAAGALGVGKGRTGAPDMLGYVASATYNNPYMPLSDEQGGVFDIMERVHALRDVRVTIGDVCGGKDVGYVAFTSAADLRRIEKGRM